MYYTKYEGIDVYGFPYHSGESDDIPYASEHIEDIVSLSGRLSNPHYYDASDLDGINIFLLVCEGNLPEGTVLEKVVHYLEDLDDPDREPVVEWKDDWRSGHYWVRVIKNGQVVQEI
jgi:hypothetical protein